MRARNPCFSPRFNKQAGWSVVFAWMTSQAVRVSSVAVIVQFDAGVAGAYEPDHPYGQRSKYGITRMSKRRRRNANMMSASRGLSTND